MKIRYAKYKCTQCGAEDTDKVFDNESPVAVVNCWKCHAGLRVPIADQLEQRKGMLFAGATA